MDSDLSNDWLAANTPLADCGPDELSVSMPILRVKLQGFIKRIPFFPSSPLWRMRSASNPPALWNSSEAC